MIRIHSPPRCDGSWSRRAKSGCPALALVLTGALAACVPIDMRGNDVTGIRQVEIPAEFVEKWPEPDQSGLIAVGNQRYVEVQQNETVESVAARLGARFAPIAEVNGVRPSVTLQAGRILRVPSSAFESAPAMVAEIAADALSTVDADEQIQQPVDTAMPPGQIRHEVQPGETVFSIARMYGVPVRTVAEWNSLGPDFSIRQGQTLLIPFTEPVDEQEPEAEVQTAAQEETPLPPTASTPLPEAEPVATLPPSPNFSQYRTAPDSGPFMMPVEGEIISGYTGPSGGNEGIDIAAADGTSVLAAADGVVALVSRSSGQAAILLIRHPDDVYSVYSNLADVSVVEGDEVQRGEPVGRISDGYGHLHFEIRIGTESTDPVPYFS